MGRWLCVVLMLLAPVQVWSWAIVGQSSYGQTARFCTYWVHDVGEFRSVFSELTDLIFMPNQRHWLPYHYAKHSMVNPCDMHEYDIECISKIKSILSFIFYSKYEAVSSTYTFLAIIMKMCTSSYYHNQIGSMHNQLFNKCRRCMCSYASFLHWFDSRVASRWHKWWNGIFCVWNNLQQ